MDPATQFIVPTIIDVPELIVTSEDVDFDDSNNFGGDPFGGDGVLMNRLQFLSSALTYIIGLGNIWRFPYLCYKHAGGAFLIAYTLILIIVGIPLLLMELAFGQYANEGPITIWRISPAFEGIGYAMCLVSLTTAFYYNFINTWILEYMVASLSFGSLPWTTCDNRWNSDKCFFKQDRLSGAPSNNCTTIVWNNGTSSKPTTITTTTTTIDNATQQQVAAKVTNNDNSILSLPGNCTAQIGADGSVIPLAFEKLLNTTDEVILPSNEYFHNRILEISDSPNHFVGLNWYLLFTVTLVWLGVFIILLKNLHRPVASDRNLALLSLIMPYLTLFALFIRSITLPGASLGVNYYFTIDWNRFQDIDIWMDATTQLFFAMGPCWGGIITLANMNKFHNNFHANTMLIVISNYLTSLLMGLITFATIGYMSNYSGVALNEVADSGIGFIFQVLPETIGQLPLANINSYIIFGVLLYLGITSELTVIETAITTIVDTWPHKLRYRRPLVLMILCTTMVILSAFMCFNNGFYLIQSILDTYAGTFTGMLIGVLELIAIAWVYGMDNFMQDIDDMISVHRNLFPSRTYWYFKWRYLAPSVLFAILLFSVIDLTPLGYRETAPVMWTNSIGWTLTLLNIALILMIALVRFLLTPQGSFEEKLSYLCRPSEDWAPSSYVSGPKLINRHEMLDESDLMLGSIQQSESSRNDDDTNTLLGSHHSGPKTGIKDNGIGTVYPSGRERIPASGPYRDNGDGDDDDDGGGDSDGEEEEEEGDGVDESANSDDCNDFDSEDLKIVDGKANYIIPEEEDDTDTGLITGETNV